MSVIYNKIVVILNKITDEFKKSFIFTTIFSILNFIEKKWVNSFFFKRLYPSGNFLGFIQKNKILNNYIFSPLIVLVVFSIFLLLSLNRLSFSLFISIIIGFVAFFIGSVVIPKFLLNNTGKIIISFKSKDMYSLGFCLILVSVVFFFISIVSVGGIPILNPSIRYLLKPIFTMPVFLIIPGICIIASVYLKYYHEQKITRQQARFRFLCLIILSCVFLLALGYRTPLLAVLLVIIIMGYYGDILAVWEVVIGALIGIGAIMGIGYYRSLSEYTVSSAISPFYTLQTRADFTLHVLDLLNYIGGNFGITHGDILTGAIPGSELGPRMMVGKLIDWRSEVTVTPSLIGQMVADFGKIGVGVEMFILGFILGIGFKIMRKTNNYFYIGLYSLILSYSILGVETGILDIQVLVYFGLALFIYLIYIAKNDNLC